MAIRAYSNTYALNESNWRPFNGLRQTAIIITSLQGEIEFINSYGLQLLDYDLKEVEGRQFSEISKDLFCKDEKFSPHYFMGEIARRIDLIRKDRISVSGLLQGHKEIWFQNEHFLMEFQKAPEVTLEKYEKILKFAGDIYYIISPDGEMEYISPNCYVLLGIEQKEFFCKKCDFLIHPEDRAVFRDNLEKIKNGQELVAFRLRFMNAESAYRIFEMHLFFSQDNVSSSQRRVYGMGRDITDRLLQEGQKIADISNAALAEGHAMLNAFGVMSHEIRQPISCIIQAICLLKGQSLPSEQVKELLVEMERSSKIVQNLISHVLDFRKLEEHCLELEFIDFSLVDVLKNVYQQTELLKHPKKLNVIFPTEKELLKIFNGQRYFIGDSLRLGQILMNILSNAIKFTPTEGLVKFTVKLFPGDDAQHRRLQFIVSDTGIGIDEVQLKELFQPFKQLKQSISRLCDGSGLGLNISKKLVDLMGGTIDVKSKPNEGATFTVTIPFPLGSQEKAKVEEVTQDYTGYFLGDNLTALLVEDNTGLQLTGKRMLQKLGMAEVIVVDNGLQAIDAVKSRSFDLIIMDRVMPECNGIEATRAIRKIETKSIPIILCTAINELNEIPKEDRELFHAILKKPFTFNALALQLVELDLQRTKEENQILKIAAETMRLEGTK